jgi:hypothetical protein
MAPQTSRPLRSTGEFARLVHSETRAADRLQRGVELVVQLVADCDHAGVTAGTSKLIERTASRSR